jgi:hypothetical protein
MQDLIRTQKQNYLRTHVLEKGYDAEDFSHFIGKMKTGGILKSQGEDIDNWSMDELETLVELYKKSLDKPGVVSRYKLQEIDLDVGGVQPG